MASVTAKTQTRYAGLEPPGLLTAGGITICFEADIDNVLGETPAPGVRGPPQEAYTAQADTLRITDVRDLRVRVLEAKILD